MFLTLVFGIVDFARFLESWVTVQHAAREGARYALTGRSDCDIAGDDRLACIEYAAQHAAVGLTGTEADVEVTIRAWYYPGYTDPPHDGTAGSACDAVEVAVEYDHHFMTPLVSSIIDHVPLRGSDRVLNEPFGPCGSGH